MRQDWLSRHVVFGPQSSAYRWLTAAWALAVAARLTLAEAQQASWLLPSGTLVVGSLGLLLWGGRLFWLLCAVGVAAPLFFLRDWLTQTLIMLLLAAVGAVTAHRPEEGGSEGAKRAAAPLLAAARWLALATYAVAAFHKLNRDFFDPAVSCAQELVRQLGEALPGLGALTPPSTGALAGLAVGVELLLPLLLWWRPRIGIIAALLFHLPLTLAFAPAFVFVMAVGWVALLGADDRAALVRVVRARWPWLVAFGLAATGTLVAWMRAFPVVDLALKLALLFFALAALVLVVVREGSGGRAAPLARRRLLVPALALAIFLVNALTPYLGTQVQHAGAMLSNLRVDAGCWNHWLVPEGVRLVDAYVRIDEARLGGEAARARGAYGGTERLLVSRLWSTTALRQMRVNWCNERTRPIALWGTFLGAPLHLADLCDEAVPLPVGPGVWLLPELFPGYLRFQKGLTRQCPQACLH
jgi:hypothetical protein